MGANTKPLKELNREVNHDLNLVNNWLRVNKIILDTKKTEIVLFHPNSKHEIQKKNL